MVDQNRYCAVRARYIALSVLCCISCNEAHTGNKSPLLPCLSKSNFAGRNAPDSSWHGCRAGEGTGMSPYVLRDGEQSPGPAHPQPGARRRQRRTQCCRGGFVSWHYVRSYTALDLFFLQFTRQKVFGKCRLCILQNNKKVSRKSCSAGSWEKC